MDTKTCIRCGEDKPLDNFYARKNQCKPCLREKQSLYRNSRPNFNLSHNLKQRYGITIEEYQTFIANQNFACAICTVEISDAVEYKAGRSVVVDHNHETGEVRGILCSKCNLVLGQARESTDVLYRAIVYLSERGAYTPKKQV